MNKMNYGCEDYALLSAAARQVSVWRRHSVFWQTVRGIYFGTFRGAWCAGIVLSGGADRAAGSVYFL